YCTSRAGPLFQLVRSPCFCTTVSRTYRLALRQALPAVASCTVATLPRFARLPGKPLDLPRQLALLNRLHPFIFIASSSDPAITQPRTRIIAVPPPTMAGQHDAQRS